ncbi:MAG: hypothetical protein ACOYI5_10390 [Christensenellales bacterium]|jgi:hypothetical protein
MGGFIDRIAITALLAGALYLFFMSAFQSIPLAAASAFLAMALLKKLTGRIPRGGLQNKRRARSEAADTLEEWAFLNRDEAREHVQALLARAYPGQMADASLSILSRHPSGDRVTVDDVIAAWKRHRGGARAVIAAFSRADDRAVALANALKSPQVRLIDGAQLAALIARHPPAEKSPPRAVKKTGRAKALLRAAGRARAGRCLASGGAMLLIYMITGMLTYLVAGAALVVIAGVSLKRRGMPRALFAE